MVAVYDFTLREGEDFIRSIYYQNSIGEPIKIDDCKIDMQIKSSFENPQNLKISLSNTQNQDGVISLTPDIGLIKIFIFANRTSNINEKKLIYDLRITFPDGLKKRLLEGKVYFSKAVTN